MKDHTGSPPDQARLMRRSAFWALLAAMALWPGIALADAGTPLMWASGLHLLFGNLLIGIAEGWMLAAIFKLKAGSCVGVMIAANYFSAWVGGVFLASSTSDFLDVDLYNAWRWLWVMVAMTYLLTLLLEWPFVALCLRKTDGWFRKSIHGSLIVQTVTYVVLFGWYWLVSGTSLLTNITLVQPSEIHVTEGALLYYISDDDGDVYARDLSSGQTTRVATLGSAESDGRLLFRKASGNPGRWDLVARLETVDRNCPLLPAILPAVTDQAAPSLADTRDPPSDSWSNFGAVPRLGPEEKGSWEYLSGFWPLEGLYGTNRDGRSLHFSLETPFMKWAVRNATKLPDDKVVFQLGSHQICVVDPEDRRIALLAKGRGPAVTIARSAAGATSAGR